MSVDNLAFYMDVKVSKSNDVTTEIKTPDQEVDHPLQLKALFELGSKDKYFNLLLVVIILSISLQVIFTICMLIIWSVENEAVDNIPESLTEITEKGLVLKDKKVANVLDKVGNLLVLCIIMANVFIVGFGVESHGPVNSSANNISA